jgi:hypothetical protein
MGGIICAAQNHSYFSAYCFIIDCFDPEYSAYYLPNTVLENSYVPDYLYASDGSSWFCDWFYLWQGK